MIKAFEYSFMGKTEFVDFEEDLKEEFLPKKSILACAAVHNQYTFDTQKEVDKRREKGQTIYDIF